MEIVTCIHNIQHKVEYKETKIGDLIFNKNNNTIYEASISDADDLNWIIIK